MSIKRRSEQVDFPNAFAAQVSPLGESDLAVVRRAMAQIAPDWAVQLDGICADEATLVLVPEDGDDEVGPSFVISRERCGLRVDQVHWDEVTEFGVYASLHDVLEIIRIRLTFCIDSSVVASVTLH